MFKACFVARIDTQRTSSHIFCQFRNEELGTTTSLPTAQHLGNFCFPLGPENVKPQEYAAPEEYSFTLTGGDGSHLHGFCRSFLPPRQRHNDGRRNANLRLPQVLCVISPFPWFPFYFKILQVVEALLKQGDLLISCTAMDMPSAAPAAAFMQAVLLECKGKPQLGRVVRVALPSSSTALNVSPQRRIQGLDSRSEPPLQSTARFIELQIPPDAGNGSWNAGTPLARLFWHLPSGSLMALLQAVLLERRILMVAQERDTLSAAVHAVGALLYPFRWQHIFLPLLPHNLKDYLTAPMPYLIGVPAPQLLLGLRNLSLEDVVYVDLDAGSCTAEGPNGPPLDYALLPWSHQLQGAFQIVYQMLRSPTEFESTPVIGHCLQEYFLKLLGSYREYIELDEPLSDPQLPAAVGPLGTRQQVQDDGYLRAHGFRFDHLSFVANQRRSEKARNFLDLLRHSQMYEVFINERLALAAGNYKSSDAFEAKVNYLQGKRARLLGRLVAQASAKGVSNLSAVLQRTSTLVKSGVAQIRHVHTPFEDPAHTSQPFPADDTIVPSYSIDLDSPTVAARVPANATLQRPVPSRGEDPSSFFNHDPDAEEDAPPEEPSRPSSPLRRTAGPTALVTSTSGLHLAAARMQSAASLSSPRSTGIIKGADGFDALLNLDGVEGVFSGPASDARRAVDGRDARAASLLDDDGPADETSTSAFDLSSWGLGLPTVSEAASSVVEWASSIQALASSFNGSEAKSPEPSTSAVSAPIGRQPSYDLKNAASLGTIDPFQDFRSPEAVRASSLTRPTPLTVPEPRRESGLRTSNSSPASSTCQDSIKWPQEMCLPFRNPTTLGHHPKSSAGSHTEPSASSGWAAPMRTGSSSLDDRFGADPFSRLDPIGRQPNRAPMVACRSGRLGNDEVRSQASADPGVEAQLGCFEASSATDRHVGPPRQRTHLAAVLTPDSEPSKSKEDHLFDTEQRTSLLDL